MIDINFHLEGRCLDGRRYTPTNRNLDDIFDETFSCKKKESNWNSTLLTNLRKDEVNITEYDFLLQNGMVEDVEDTYDAYKNITINWNPQKNDEMYIWQESYPTWDYERCVRKGYHAKTFKSFVGKMSTINNAALAVSIL